MTAVSPDPIQQAAHEAIARGFNPVILRPQTKIPAESGWTEKHYTDPEAFDRAYRDVEERYPDQPLNLGLALGEVSGGLIDIDFDDARARRLGADLLPRSAMASGRPGSPGSHAWFLVDGYDPGVKQFKLPGGSVLVEWRGRGGQTVVPPSIHPESRETYQWFGDGEWGGADGPLRLDEGSGRALHQTIAAIALAVTLADNWPDQGGRHGAYLALAGWLLRDEDENGQPTVNAGWHANLPGLIRMIVGITHDRDGAHSRISEAVESTRRKILRGKPVQGWPTLAEAIGTEHAEVASEIVEEIEEISGNRRERRSKAMKTGGLGNHPDEPQKSASVDVAPRIDTSAVDVAMLDDADRDPLAERASEWAPLDLGPYVRGGVKPPEPEYLHRDDGPGLIYPGRVNLLYGAAGSGKTLIAMDVMARMLQGGDRVMFLDLEDEPVSIIERLRQLGVPDEIIASPRFAYVHPERERLAAMEVDRFGDPHATKAGLAQQAYFAGVIERVNPSLIVVDGTTTLYRIHGLDTNGVLGADVIGGWLRDLTGNYTRSVLMIDHTPKNSGPTDGPIGSQHKIAMVQGIALRVNPDLKPRPGQQGRATITIGKDRLGRVLKHAVGDSDLVAEVIFDSDEDGSLRISYGKPNPLSTSGVQVTGGSSRKPSGRPPAYTDDQRRALIDVFLDSGDWMTRADAIDRAGLIGAASPDSERKLLTSLVDEKVLEKSKPTGAGRAAEYRIIPGIRPAPERPAGSPD